MKCPHCRAELNLKELRQRSLYQNKYYFYLVKILSDETGYSKNEMHEMLKSLFLSEIKMIKTKEGLKDVRVSRSTTDLTTIEAEDYYREIREWASKELSIYLPLPNEIN